MSSELECEIQAITAVTLANAILENVKGIGHVVIPGFISLYLN